MGLTLSAMISLRVYKKYTQYMFKNSYAEHEVTS